MTTLRAVAVAPPGLPEGGLGQHTLKSDDPASLFNACRVAAQRAELGVGAWGDSNWAASRHTRRECLLLMSSLREDISEFEKILAREKPNLLLLGAMTVCLPGAVACAQHAKEMFGDDLFVVLGGRHPSESVYDTSGSVVHHVSSPARLMAEGHLPHVFDLVVSGEGEHLIAEFGEMIGTRAYQGPASTEFTRHLSTITTVPGKWILSWYDGSTVESVAANHPIDHDTLPPPAPLFGVRSSFDVFDGRMTGHVFSDSGNGCVFDCGFCSERKSVTGGPVQVSSGADRLVRQMCAVADVVAEEHPDIGASAFVEDSTLLAGSPRQIQRLVELLTRDPIDIRFGGQFTSDQILMRQDALKQLHRVGFDYLFLGIETLDPTYIGGMSKDRRSKKERWISRSERVVEFLAEVGIRSGAAVLFGLGEPQEHRLMLLEELARWNRVYGSPAPISLNWATQHPLQNGDVGYRYDEWSVPPGEWSDTFKDFGESTVIYPIAGVAPPVLDEVREVCSAFDELLAPAATGRDA